MADNKANLAGSAGFASTTWKAGEGGNLPKFPEGAKGRRDFLGLSLAGMAGIGALGMLGAMKRSWDPLPSVVTGGFTVVDLSALKEGEVKSFEWRGQPVYVAKKTKGADRVEGRDFELDGVVYSVGLQICTHLGCIPQYFSAKKAFVCACHGGMFDASGVNIKGPPSYPMLIPPFNITGSKLVFGEEGEIYKGLKKA